MSDDEWLARRLAVLEYRRSVGFSVVGAGKTHNEQRISHGITRYRKGCRCDTCVEAMRAKSRAYRERRRKREASA